MKQTPDRPAGGAAPGRIRRRLILVAGLLVLAVGGLWLVRTTGRQISLDVIQAALARLGPWGPVALILAVAAVLVVPVVPATVLHIGAGLAFGPWWGLLYMTLADVLGASLGFWLARRWGLRLLSRLVDPAANNRLRGLSQRMTWRSVMLLRLLPGPAYPLVSFAAGCATLPYRHYIVASVAGVLPALALVVLAGDLVTHSPWLAFALIVAVVGGLAWLGQRFVPPTVSTPSDPADRSAP